ncbi:MAG: 2Fe-2S iron-sulfur cluster binding domain-containing protein [Deltaproteobacteria bacterium]|nr:2Fe-2S iron-sulfur cluster binding domain-containing protein [Deltaproteobacteria bacterium]
MPVVQFLPSRKKIDVPSGTSLYAAAQCAGLPLASSCSAEFACGKCNVQVTEGAEHLSIQTEAERHLLAREKKPGSDRIGCQAKVLGSCTITTRYW